MTLSELKSEFHKQLSNQYPSEEIDTFYYWLLEDFLEISRLDVALYPQKILDEEGLSKMEGGLKRLQKSEPVQYITGKTEFYGLPFKVSPAVLIPRPETEELVDLILSEVKASSNTSPKVLDIGTGSGCIGISLAKNLPQSQVSLLDVSEKALTIAKENAEKNQVNIAFLHQDILQADTLPKKYDIIVSNPPYVRMMEKSQMQKNVLDFEPELALFVTDENPLLFYTKIAALAEAYLIPSGKLFFEINEYLGNDLKNHLAQLKFKDIRIYKDFAGKDRIISAIKND